MPTKWSSLILIAVLLFGAVAFVAYLLHGKAEQVTQPIVKALQERQKVIEETK